MFDELLKELKRLEKTKSVSIPIESDEKGYAEESCRLLLDYGFNELYLNKIWTEIYEFDDKKKALYDKFDFRQDGLLRQNYWYDGKWWDSRILSILKSENSIK